MSILHVLFAIFFIVFLVLPWVKSLYTNSHISLEFNIYKSLFTNLTDWRTERASIVAQIRMLHSFDGTHSQRH